MTHTSTPPAHRTPAAAPGRPLPTRRAWLCRPCETTWTGTRTTCWHCGEVATSDYATPGAATAHLLQPAQPQPAAAKTQEVRHG